MSVHIMVFDSGIGGTTVLEQIQALIPNADYSYFMDNALLPYGAQSQQTIIARLFALLQFIETANLHVDILVIACNTASTSALETIRQHTSIEVVGVVPAIKPACATRVEENNSRFFRAGSFVPGCCAACCPELLCCLLV